MNRLRSVSATGVVRLSVLGVSLATALSDAALADSGARGAQGIVAGWNQIPAAQLQAIWSDAQSTAGLLAIEPESHVVGAQAAKKKTWDFADDVFKLFAGKSPIWFPADLVRHTTCGADARWSYFWWFASGPERDLHPWLKDEGAFRHLVGAYAGALSSSRALDLSDCSDVGGSAGQPCLYGEVTTPERFEKWFCGGSRSACKERLSEDPSGAPPGFSNPDQLCFMGPWVLERVHQWRPEIHPAEVLWSRPRGSETAWRVALLPDDSGRFQSAEHYAALDRTVPFQPWSRERPVELWLAFDYDPAKGLVLDLARDELRNGAREPIAVTVPPAGSPFQQVTVPFDDVLVAVRSWSTDSGRARGLLVMRSTLGAGGGPPLLLGVTGRAPDAPPSQWPFLAVDQRRAAAREVVMAPEVRLLPFSRVRKKGEGHFEVQAQVRFDPRRPAVPADEERTDLLNEALKGSDKDRRRELGKDRPFTFEVRLEAVRDDCSAVPIVYGSGSRPDAVVVKAERGKVTELVEVEGAGPRRREEFGDVVTVATLTLRIPPGVSVTGSGLVQYTGRPVGLAETAVRTTFAAPRPTHADEWGFLREVLADIDAGTADARLLSLQADACAPYVAPCSLDDFVRRAAPELANPVKRWLARREIHAAPRAFARFVRMAAVAFRWDGEVTYEEHARLWRLLSAAFEPGRRAAGTEPARRCR